MSNSDDTIDKKQQYKGLIKGYFEGNNNYGDHSFKGMFRRSIESISQQFFNILSHYFDTYDESYFHKRMNGSYTIVIKSRDGKEPSRTVTLPGFNFLQDWKDHHRTKFAFFVHTARVQKTWFIFDEQKIFDTIVKLMETKGWVLSEREKESIKYTVRRLYNVLYLNWDSVE